MRALLVVIVWCGACAAAHAGSTPATGETTASRLSLRHAQVTPRVASDDGSLRMRARVAPRVDSGVLREGGDFVLIGRLAKGAVSCSVGNAIFGNGFEDIVIGR